MTFAVNTMSTEDQQEVEILRENAARFAAQHSSGSRLRRIRQQFGKPIGSFQVLQHRAVNLYIQQELCDVSITDALAEFRRESLPRSRSLAASRAKARSSDAALLVTREAVQMHGAVGFTDLHDIGLYLKRALVQSAWLGNAAQQRRRYAAVLREQGSH
jgi:alkylation response protein AidB-like acyl-CoA dehydrogenase